MRKGTSIGCFILWLLAGPQLTRAQSPKIDSLLKVVKSAGEDTNKVNALNALAWEFKYGDPDTSLIILKNNLALAEKIKWQKGIANTLANIGGNYVNRADYLKALEFYNKALKIDQAQNNKTGIAKIYNNIGIVHRWQADYPKALESYFKSLKLAEELKDKRIQTNVLGNIGIIYKEQSDYTHALEYYSRALKIDEELGDKRGIAIDLGNIGIIYQEQGALSTDDSAKVRYFRRSLDHYSRSLKIREEIGAKSLIASVLGNIGNLYASWGDNAKALDHFQRSLAIRRKMGAKHLIASTLGNIGSLHFKTGRYADAENFLKHAVALYDSIGGLDGVRDFEKTLSQLYDTTGRYKLALEHYKKHIAARDSIANEENVKKQTQLEMNYEFEKQQAADSIRNAEQRKQEQIKHDQEITEQRIYTFGGGIGFVLMLAVAGVSFRAYRQKQRANEIISRQKHLVEEKQKEILDSIHYARRIQRSHLPTTAYIKKTLSRLNPIDV